MTDLPSSAPPLVPGWPVTEQLDDVAVVLGRPRLEDAEAAYALQSDPRLYVDVPPDWRVQSVAAQVDELRRHVAHWHEYGFGYWLVWPAGTDPTAPGGRQPLGIAGLRWMWWRGEWVLNVFVRFAATAHGRGLATLVLDHAISRLDTDLASPVRVVVRTREGNEAMVALARRLGMVDTGDEDRELGTYRLLERLVGGPARPPDGVPDMRARATGAWVVQAHVPVHHRQDPSGGTVTVAPDRRHGDVAVCRCGRTATPPTCDRSHVEVDMARVGCAPIFADLGDDHPAGGPDGACAPARRTASDRGDRDRLARGDVADRAAACPPGSVLVLGDAGGGADGGGAIVVIGAGVRVRLLDGTTVRAPVPLIACRCGTHVTAVASARR